MNQLFVLLQFSGLMGLFEKRRFRNFLVACTNATDTMIDKKIDITKQTMAEVYKHYGLDANTQDFVGHAIALYYNDE